MELTKEEAEKLWQAVARWKNRGLADDSSEDLAARNGLARVYSEIHDAHKQASMWLCETHKTLQEAGTFHTCRSMAFGSICRFVEYVPKLK